MDDEPATILIVFIIAILAVGSFIAGIAWLFMHEPDYFFGGIGVIIVIAFFILLLQPSPRSKIKPSAVDGDALTRQASQAQTNLAHARQQLEREAAALERLRLEKQGEIYFEMFRQKHFESFTIADRWHDVTRNTLKIRRTASDGLTTLRDNKRRLASKRDRTHPARRHKVVVELRQTQHVIDQLYAALSSLDKEIERGKSERTAYNNQTAKLRDHIKENCGPKGRQWYARLEARKQKKLDN